MKRIISLCMLLCAVLSALSLSSFTLQSSRVYQSADDSGAYEVSFSGSHADITRYASDTISVGLNLSYTVSGVCAYHGRIVMFCDDSANNQLIVYVYYLDSDILDSFAIYGARLYGDTDFCCDDNAVYIENHRDNRELVAYSYSGNITDRYRFDQRITALCSGYDSGVYAVSDDRLYRLSGGSLTAVAGCGVEAPLFPADSRILVSDYGCAYVLNGNSISRSFDVDSQLGTASACVIGDRLYYPCGSVVNGYDIVSGEKVCVYRLSFDAALVYADGGNVTAVKGGSCTAVSPGDFTELNAPVADNKRDDNKSDHTNESGSSEISSEVYRIDHERNYIYGISPDTTVALFKKNMHYDGWTLALYRDSSVKTSGNVGTAMTAVFTSDSGSITFELCVSGDLTGEGNLNSRDINTLLDYLIGSADFSGVYTLAADLSGDDTVDAADAALLKRMTG